MPAPCCFLYYNSNSMCWQVSKSLDLIFVIPEPLLLRTLDCRGNYLLSFELLLNISDAVNSENLMEHYI